MSYSEAEGVVHSEISSVFDDTVYNVDKGYAKGPERSLMSALLFDAIQNYMNYASGMGGSRSRHKEAFNWVHMDKGREYIFSFESVCDALGIDSNFLRLGLLNAYRTKAKQWKKARRNF